MLPAPTPLRDFDGLGRACLIIGGVMALVNLDGLFRADPMSVIADLKAAGGNLPEWFPVGLFAHYRVMNGVELLPNLLMAIVGLGLLRRSPWSIAGLRFTAWLFLMGTILGTAWLVKIVQPGAPVVDPVGQWFLEAFAWSMVVAAAAMVASIGWLLLRLRGARFSAS